jgi:outer membrane protein OmpA-like peptidoglycan-associated protein
MMRKCRLFLLSALWLQISFAQKIVYTIEGVVSDAADNTPLSEALVVVTSNTSTNQIRILTDEMGRYKVGLQQGQSYLITAIRNDYFAQPAVKINTIGEQTHFQLPIKLRKIEKNKPLPIDSIYFDISSDSLLPASNPALLQLQLLLSLNSRIKVEIAVHTDSRGDDDFNLGLSQLRAVRLTDYLVSKGIDGRRITPKGYGETRLLNHCRNDVKCSNAEHLVNRRVELIITEY